MEDKLIELLKSLGLSKSEIEVYIDLLRNPISSAYVIANRINQHRSSVYEALKKLMQRGFIVEIPDNNRKLYQTKEYTAIEEYINQKKEELKEITPYLKDISNTAIPAGSISISYGLSRLRTMFSNLFELKKEIIIWTLPKDIDKTIGDWFLEEINEKIVKNEIPAKIIYSKYFNLLDKIEKNPFIHTRALDEESNIFTIVCSDQVFLVVLGNPISVIEMKSEIISDGFRARFDTSWKKAGIKEGST